MKSRYLDVFTYLALLGAMIAILCNLVLMWTSGSVLIYENNNVILIFEIVFISSILVFVVIRLINIYWPVIKIALRRRTQVQ